ncbi:MAG: peptidylprolyl isomerase [Eubacteriales bacterium]|nr:peptidylprolyl isomerase [Eubacteriales bacterium]
MAKKQLDDDLLTGGSLNSDKDKSAKKAEKNAAKAAKKREKNDAKRAEIKKQIDALKQEKASETDEKKIEELNAKIKKLSDKYTSVGSEGTGVPKRTARIIKSVICIVIVVALLVTYVATGAVRKGFVASLGIPAQHFTGMTVTNGEQKAKIKVATYNYYFALTYNNLRSTQEQYTQYGLDPAEYDMDVDFDQKLSKQMTKNHDDEEVTWAEYLYDEVLESIEETYTYYLAAVEANGGEEPEITDEQKSELDDTLSQYRETAESYGYTLSGYLVKAMGKGVTESVFRTETTRSYIADNYKTEIQEKIAEEGYSQEDYDAYKDEHKDELKSVDIRFFECTNEDDAKAFKAALKADGSNFTSLCGKYTSSDSTFYKTAYANEDGYSTIYGATKSILESKGLAIATADDKDETPGLDWLFSSDRNAGDAYQYSTTVVYVLSPASISDMKTANVRHILIAPETDDEDTDATDATTAQWKDAEKKANDLLAEFKKDATEDNFASLVADNTDDTGSAETGGLYEDVVPGQMVDSFSAWCFEPGRKAGDTGIVKSDFGYHIMYYVGDGDLAVWEQTANDALSSNDSSDASSKLEEEYTLKVNWFGSRYFEKDVDIDN